MNSKLFRILPLSLLCAVPLTAQDVTPAGYSDQPGRLWHHTAPLGGYQKSIVQQIHEDLRGQRRTVRGLAFRRALDVASAGAHRIQATILVGRSSGVGVARTFAANYAEPPQVVADRKWFDLPDWRGSRASYPAGFDAVLEFDHAYEHDGSAGLVWEVRVHDHEFADAHGRAPNYIVDAFRGEQARHLPEDRWGRGCDVAGRFLPMETRITGDATFTGQWRLQVHCNHAPFDQQGWFVFGTQRANLRLPGACSEMLVGNVLGVAPNTTNEHSAPRITGIRIPVDVSAVDAELVVQAVVPDPGRSSGLPLSMASAAAVRLIAPPPPPPPVGMVVAKFSDSASVGTARPSYGLVVALR